jgi:hypothetical protein
MLMLQAIRDGVIEASLDHENGWMQSKDTSDIYATRQDHTHTSPVLPDLIIRSSSFRESFNPYSEAARKYRYALDYGK